MSTENNTEKNNIKNPLEGMSKKEIHEKIAFIEAILFAVGNSVSIDRISEALEIDKKTVKALLEVLKSEYKSDKRGIELVELENSVQLGTKTFAYDVLAKIGRATPKYTLTESVLETLSIVAYKQPVTRAQIEKIRGVACDHAIQKLMEYELIEDVGRLDAPGRPLLFATTEQFLRAFGVKSLSDLPQASAELIADFKSQAEYEAFDEEGFDGVRRPYVAGMTPNQNSDSDLEDAYNDSYNDSDFEGIDNDSDNDSDGDSDEIINVEV